MAKRKTPEQVAKDMFSAWEDFTNRVVPAFLVNSIQRVAKDRKEGFMKGEGPNGERWAKLKPATIKKKKGEHSTQRVKRKNGISGVGKAEAKPSKYPDKPLIDTGAMMNATTHVSKGKAYLKPARSRAEPTTGGFDSIMKIHQDGLGNNPPRPHWGIYKKSTLHIRLAWKAAVKMLAKSMMR